MRWQIKAFSQKLISFLPWSYKLNYLAQNYFTVGDNLPDEFVFEKIKASLFHLENLKFQPNPRKINLSILEVGTGWYPLVPLFFYLNGFENIILFDKRKLYNNNSLRKTILAIEKMYEKKILQKEFDYFDENRYFKLLKLKGVGDIEQGLINLGIRSCFGSLSTVENLKIDFVVSNNTIQFISLSNLERLVSKLSEIIHEDGLISFSIDLTDEFSHSDKSLSKFNFLKYSKIGWYIVTNRLNRPRRTMYSQYKFIFEKNFAIIHENLTKLDVGELHKIKVNREFNAFALEELRISIFDLVLIKLKVD
ncbi:MAG: hypothetical protein ACK5B9_05290 [Flavobacteriia bacterium]